MKTFLLICLFLLPQRLAWATPGVDDSILTAVLETSIEHLLEAKRVAQDMAESLKYAEESAKFAEEALQMGKNVQTLFNDPELFLRETKAAWDEEFPEINAMVGRVDAVRKKLERLTMPQLLPSYDPQAYRQVYDDLKKEKIGAFNAMSRAADKYKLHDNVDRSIRKVKKLMHDGLNTLSEVSQDVVTKTLRPVDAAVQTAKATAVTAVAQTHAAKALIELVRDEQLEFMHTIDATVNDRVSRSKQEIAATAVKPTNWHLTVVRGGRTNSRRANSGQH
jgi:hypothetical protein